MSLETLLAAIESADDQAALKALVEKNPKASEVLTRADAMEQWTAENWDAEHKMTKREWRQQQQIASLLEQQAAQGANPMELNELNTWMEDQIKSGRVLAPTAVDDKLKTLREDTSWLKPALETELKTREDNYNKYFSALVNTQAQVATLIPYLNQKHYLEYGELFDPEEFLNKATEAKASDLKSFYQTFTADKAKAKQEAEIEKRIAAARDEERKKTLQDITLGSEGVNRNPVSDGGPEMGHFQAKLMGMTGAKEGAAKSPVPEGAELGKGTIAAAMARAGDRAELEGRVA